MVLNYKLKKPAEFIFECLTNMTKFVSVHPVIDKANYLGKGKYQIFETLKLGFLQISFTYSVIIACNYESKQVVMKAVVMNVVKIEMFFKITEANGYSLVSEELNFNTLLPIKSKMQKLFIKQHALLFRNIEDSIFHIKPKR